jgi:hypothetical protein
MFDCRLTHHHDKSARRIAERTTCRARITLRTRPDFFLHGIMDAFQIFRPEKLDDFTRTEVVIVSCGTGRRADSTIQAAIQFVIKAKIALDILKYLFQFFSFDGRRLG